MPPRSPIIFWLLLAATICVDAVAIVWMGKPSAQYAEAAVDALLLGQLSVTCAWSALGSARSVFSRFAPVLVVIAAAMVLHLFGHRPLSGGLPYYGLHAAVLLTALWFFGRTSFWRQRSGARTELQFSIAHLLMAMTVVAVLVAAMRNSDTFYGEPHGVVWHNLAFIAGSIALAFACVVSWSLERHWILRLAGALGFALLLGAATALFVSIGVVDAYFHHFAIVIGASFLIQAVVISAWIGLGPVLPVNVAPAAER